MAEKQDRCGDPFTYPLAKKEDAWKDCHDVIKKYDEDLCKSWKEEINNLLIFAGLFSAVVTAFTVESYTWLQEDSGDVSLSVMIHISSQLAASPDNTTARTPFQQTPFTPTASAVRINTFWFLSLACSLATAIVGILCIQWLREYERDIKLSPRESFALRQMLYEGFNKWHVPTILAALPLTLEVALVFFFVGLLNLLWDVNHTVAIVAGVFLSLALLFIIVTTVLPTFQIWFPVHPNYRTPQCAYKSLQSWAFFRLACPIGLIIINPLGGLAAKHLGGVVSVMAAGWRRFLRWFNSFLRWFNSSWHSQWLKGVRAVFSITVTGWRHCLHWFNFWWQSDDQRWNLSDWGEFDIYWRTKRDTGGVTFRTDACLEVKTMHYDTIRGLKWICNRLPLGVDTNYLVIPCLLDLELVDAVRAIREIARPAPIPERHFTFYNSLGWLENRLYEPAQVGVHNVMAQNVSNLLQSGQTIRFMIHQIEGSYRQPRGGSDPLLRDMLSLLAIRYLNYGKDLHPNVRHHYLELYTRIQNTATEKDCEVFFNLPLHQSSLAPENASEVEYLEKMFYLMDAQHVQESTALQILHLLMPHVRCHSETRQSVAWRWSLLRSIWKTLNQILGHPLPFRDRGIRSQILSHLFTCCKVIAECIILGEKWYEFHKRVEDCALEMVKLRSSLSDLQFTRLKACDGFSKMRSVAKAIKGYSLRIGHIRELWSYESHAAREKYWSALRDYDY